MARRVGHREGEVVLVTQDTSLVGEGVSFVSIPPALDAMSDHEIINRCLVRDGVLVDRQAKRDPAKLRVAMVGAWGIPCGIATYAESLWPPMGHRVAEWKVFAEKNENVVDGPHVAAGLWKRGESLQALAVALESYKPDVVFIQHEYGIFPDARHWLSFIARIKPLRPIVTLHSVYRHKDKTICEAAIPEIVVHSDIARSVLREKGINAKISVIPHGCGKPRRVQLYNLYRSPHTFMQFGFGFRYKAWDMPIVAASILKKKYKDVFFTGLFSEGMFSAREHDRYYRELMTLVDQHEVRDHVAIIRGYQSEGAIDSYLGTNQVAVFAYRNDPDHIVFGASGAARRAMEVGIPVIVSKVPHFADFAAAGTPQVETPEDLALHLEMLFDHPEMRSKAVEVQNSFLQSNSWENAAAAYLDLV